MWSSVPPGCSGNEFLLQRRQKHAKRNRQKKLSVVFLDLAKAFDTISHKHISEGHVDIFGTLEFLLQLDGQFGFSL
jgi:hypothetical protein